MTHATRSCKIWKPQAGEPRLYLEGWMADAGPMLEQYLDSDETSVKMNDISSARVWADRDAMVHVERLRDPIAAEIIRISVEPNLGLYIHHGHRPR